jgi:hypothetical protein
VCQKQPSEKVVVDGGRHQRTQNEKNREHFPKTEWKEFRGASTLAGARHALYPVNCMPGTHVGSGPVDEIKYEGK